jgi:hypothetical protein
MSQSHRVSLAFLLLLALGAGGPAAADDPLPQVDSWRHQRPEDAARKVIEPKVTAPKANGIKAGAPVREQKSAAPKSAPQPVIAAPAPQLAFEPPPQAALAAEILLAEAINSLAPQRPGVHDVYFIAFAGWGDQDVFRKEAERVRDLFDARFGTKERSLLLINSPETLTRYPAATLSNLRLAISVLSQRLDPKEDVLVLFLTSHGLQNRGIATHLNGKDLGMLTPRLLAEALDQAGIKNRIVLISACFSGQFMTALESDDSLVITASSANRMSFGCTPTAEWTWFGQSYFVDALPKVGKLVPAFARAKQIVADKETAEKVVPSEPQISIGPGMARLLKELGY